MMNGSVLLFSTGYFLVFRLKWPYLSKSGRIRGEMAVSYSRVYATMAQHEDKKSIILQYINDESSINLSALLKKLGVGYTERTTRRWLAEIVKNGSVIKLGEKRGTRYKAASSMNSDAPLRSRLGFSGRLFPDGRRHARRSFSVDSYNNRP
ncbi:MAG TPA: hypothetical protein VNC84_00960 [Gammaproteobacteria bacterium]|jgi:hypothetical protein|nr:hypothetical protein [Gammaproteobacteria bacterium]